MVAKDDDGTPTEVPALLLETKEDIRRFMEAIKRRELKAAFAGEFDNEKTRMKVEENVGMLKQERCVIAPAAS